MMPLNPAHLARNSDPESSHAAAEEVAFSKRTQTQCDLIAKAVERYPGQTSRELATLPMLGDLDRYDIARRLPDLERVDRVRSRTPGKRKPILQRKCKVSGRLALTWWPSEQQRVMF